MVDLVPKKAVTFESGSLWDSFAIGAVKAIEERAMIPVVGNGSLKSAVAKGAAGVVIQSAIKGKTGKIIGSAFAIDAVEDAVQALIVPIIDGGSDTGGNIDNW
ncbi:putative small capsid protein [Methanosarcina spherical virus]|nr:hypothetical protein [Methanosarcina spherical virus]WKN02308.1 hypothetical protein HCCKFEEG_00014 [Methanosarcina spherical virus]WKN02328.1 hypothetical protein OBGAJBEG_00012 [Methanosarcina spherical virus]WKN02350.1 hypothetical protein FJIADALF_00014 [Methanosarcina spherical virus]